MDVTRKTLLLVEDEGLIALAESRALEKYGYSVLHAPSGELAVDAAREHPEISLVLMDIDLGTGIDGPEAARRILAFRELPIVFLTAHAELDFIERVSKVTRYGYAIKGSGYSMLRNSIETAFELFEANLRIKENEKRLSFALEGANDGVWEVRVPTGEGYLSPRGREMLGYGEDEFAREVRTWQELVHPGDMPITRAALDAYYAGKAPVFSVEHRLRRRDGSYIWVLVRGKVFERDGDGKPLRLVGTHTDIDERKRAERVLEEKAMLFQSLLDHSPVYVFFKDEAIRATYLSRNYETMLARPLSEILGKSMDDLFPSDLAKSMIADDKLILERNELVEADETLGGRYYTTIKFPIALDDGRRMLAGFTIDVTERELAERKTEELVREKEILLKEVYHRVKNGIASIESVVMLQLDDCGSDETRAALTDTLGRIGAMRILYDNLLADGKGDEVRSRPYLEDLVESIQGLFPDKGGVAVAIEAEDLPLPSKKATYLGMIASELVTNSFKYAYRDRSSGSLRVAFRSSETRLELEVEDDGPGLPEEGNGARGSGFGMALVHMLAEQLGGSFESRNSGSAKGRLVLPR